MCLAAQLDGEQQKKLEGMRERFAGRDGNGLPLDDPCFLRYLRARSWNVEKSADMLSSTLDWRKSFGVENIATEHMDTVRKENATGKVYVRGFDLKGRPVMYMRPRCENTGNHDGNMKHLVYQMERARHLLQDRTQGRGKMCLVIDYEGYSLRNAPPMRTSRETLHVLQNHYPETLGVAYMVSPPWIFNSFWKIIYPFIDKVTRGKFIFLREDLAGQHAQAVLAENFALGELEQAVGGKNTTLFVSETYLAGPMDTEFEALLVNASAPGPGAADGPGREEEEEVGVGPAAVEVAAS